LILVSQTSFTRGFLVLALALAASPVAAQQIPRMDPAHCTGQPEIKPLQPLEISTSKGPAKFMVEFADTEKTREYGLMCRKLVAPDRGMLFDFKGPVDNVAFWMRNTLIPLDMVFIDAKLEVAGIVENAAPQTLTGRGVGKPSKYVLEVPVGWTAKIGLKAGAKVKFEGTEGINATP